MWTTLFTVSFVIAVVLSLAAIVMDSATLALRSYRPNRENRILKKLQKKSRAD